MNSYGYGYREIAKACRRSVGAVRVDVERKRFDPSNLASVSIYIIRKRLEQEAKDGVG